MNFARFPLFGRLKRENGANRVSDAPGPRSIAARTWDSPFVRSARKTLGKPFEFAERIVGSMQAFEILKEGPRSLRTHLGLIIGFSAAINLLYLAPSLYMLQVYDRVIPTSGVLTLVLLSIVMVASLAVLAFLDAARARLLARMSVRIERFAADAVIEENMKARRSGARAVASARDLDTLRQGVTSPAAVGLLDIPWTPLFVGICFMIHFWIGALALGGAFLIFGLALINERASRDGIAKLSAKAAGFYVAHEGDLNASETIHALGAERRFRRRRARARDEYVAAQTDIAFTGAGYAAATKALRMLLQSAALGLGAYLAIERQISPGAIIAATILTARAFAPVEQIVGGWRQVGMGFAAMRSLQKLFADAKPPLQRTPLPEPEGRIQVEQVSAAAPDGRTIALHSVNLAASPGEVIGIIGSSGAGKTTLARVLANAAVPKGGAVRIDGARYADWDDEALARHIGYLPQRIDLFDGTVAENIAAFAPAVDESGAQAGPRVVEAAIAAGAHDLILRLPNGYETELGPGGAGISPGQAQRIALARAFYGNPKVVVLDEPNSHLDVEGEAALVGAIENVRARNGVVFVVAHRAGVIGVVDKLAVMREGRIIEYGPRAAVLAKMAAAAQKLEPQGATLVRSAQP
jgi:ATP-binding cassette subfamily C protein